MKNLDYKGFKSTRLISLATVVSISVLFVWFGKMTAPEWGEFVKWAFGFYVLSESANKAAEAHRDKS